MSANKYSQPLYSPYKQQFHYHHLKNFHQHQKLNQRQLQLQIQLQRQKQFERSKQRKQQFQIMLQFELKRQKEKNLILQQRLKNKQMFIEEMKLFNEDLTVTFQKCQEQLNFCKKQLNYAKNVQNRDLMEEIANLKHQVRKLQEQNYKLTHSQGTIIYSNNPNHKSNFSSNHNQNQNHLQSIPRNKTHYNSRVRGNTYSHGSQRQTPQVFKSAGRSKSRTSYVPAGSKQRQKQNEKQANLEQIQKKIMNFINQFLKMAGNYVQIDNNQNEKLTSKLKVAWKWIKNVVKQWHQNKTSIEEYQKFIGNLQDLINIEESRKGQVMLIQILQTLQQRIKNSQR